MSEKMEEEDLKWRRSHYFNGQVSFVNPKVQHFMKTSREKRSKTNHEIQQKQYDEGLGPLLFWLFLAWCLVHLWLKDSARPCCFKISGFRYFSEFDRKTLPMLWGFVDYRPFSIGHDHHLCLLFDNNSMVLMGPIGVYLMLIAMICCVMVNMNLTEGRRIGEFLTLRSLPSLQQPGKRKQFNKLQIFEPQLRQQSKQAIQERFVKHSGWMCDYLMKNKG